jgi:hypothetical protein
MRAFAIILSACAVPLAAQWLNYPARGTPRTPDGKPNLSAPAPRLGGKPDLSGVWQAEGTSPDENERLLPGIGAFDVPGDDPSRFSKYFFNLFADLRPDQVPMRPEAAQLFRQRAGVPDLSNPCLPVGVPMADLIPAPYKIIQTPRLTVILYEARDNNFRQIYTDGRKHPADPQPSWLGYSIGKWDAATFVVETVGFNSLDPIDGLGHPRSQATRITERFRRWDFGHMDVEITVDDPKNYTRPFSVKIGATLIPDTDILESICAENEKDRGHIATQ